MPELYNKDVVVQLYSDTTDFCSNNEVKGKIELQPKKPYFAFEIREDKKLK